MNQVAVAISFGCFSIVISISLAAFSITTQIIKLREDLKKYKE